MKYLLWFILLFAAPCYAQEMITPQPSSYGPITEINCNCANGYESIYTVTVWTYRQEPHYYFDVECYGDPAYLFWWMGRLTTKRFEDVDKELKERQK